MQPFCPACGGASKITSQRSLLYFTDRHDGRLCERRKKADERKAVRAEEAEKGEQLNLHWLNLLWSWDDKYPHYTEEIV